MRIIFVLIGASIVINVKEANKAVPPQVKGAKSDIVHSVVTATDQHGRELYEKARKNMLNINGWQQLAGKLSAAFYLTDPFGQNVDR